MSCAIVVMRRMLTFKEAKNPMKSWAGADPRVVFWLESPAWRVCKNNSATKCKAQLYDTHLQRRPDETIVLCYVVIERTKARLAVAPSSQRAIAEFEVAGCMWGKGQLSLSNAGDMWCKYWIGTYRWWGTFKLFKKVLPRIVEKILKILPGHLDTSL